MERLPQEDRLAYTIRDVCRILGLGRNKVSELIHGGRLRSVRVGTRHIIPRSSLERFLDGDE